MPKYLAFSVDLFDMMLERAPMPIFDFSDVIPLVFHPNTNPKPFFLLKIDIYPKYVSIWLLLQHQRHANLTYSIFDTHAARTSIPERSGDVVADFGHISFINRI